MGFDLIIKNGTVVDGTGTSGRKVDIGVRGDTIAAIDNFVDDSNSTRLDAGGMVVAPGFVDIHSHSDFLWLARPESDSKVLDGVTTEICGNCGMSAFPLRGKVLERRAQGLSKYGIDITWQTAADFFDMAGKASSSINRAFLVGHGNIRACTVEYENRIPTSHELFRMKQDLEAAMIAGAFGMSSGLIYPPGCYAQRDELIEMCKMVADYDGFYSTHIRNEGDTLEEALSEAIDVAGQSDVRLQVSHLKTSGNRNWGKVHAVKGLIERAIDNKVKITCDRYPYTAAATDLDSILPHWVYEGGIEQQILRLKDASLRKRITDELAQKEDDSLWDEVMISSVRYEKNRWTVGKTVSEIAQELRKSPIETVFDLLIDEETRVDIFLFSMCEENLERILGWNFVFVGSDSSMRSVEGVLSEGKPHPRSYGTFSRVLGRFCRDKQLLSLENAIQKMTGLPAQKVGLKKRGLLKEGYFADITIFDPRKVTDRSTFIAPHQYSSGVEHVVVNGQITVNNGKHTGITGGRVLRKS